MQHSLLLSAVNLLIPLLYPRRCSEILPNPDAAEHLSKSKSSFCAHCVPCWPFWSKLWRCRPQNQKKSSLCQTWVQDPTQLKDWFSVTCECASESRCSCVLSGNIHSRSPRALKCTTICRCQAVQLQWSLEKKTNETHPSTKCLPWNGERSYDTKGFKMFAAFWNFLNYIAIYVYETKARAKN